jgi:hypothetical protein
MELGNAHAVLIDLGANLGAKGKLDAICNAITPLFLHDNKWQS